MRHILWVNEQAQWQGGCEQYIRNTVTLLKARGVRASLLYDGTWRVPSPEYLRVFDAAFPIVDVARQVHDIAPGLVYIHRVDGPAIIRKFASTGIPTARFLHDHKLFCLREHKYKALSHNTCVKPIGLRCYVCPGFVRRSSGPLRVGFASLHALRAEQRVNRDLDAFVVGSEYMRGHMAEHGFDRGRVHVLPLYAFPPDAATGVVREPDLLLFVGQLVRGKGVDVLLNALSETRTKARLVILGAGRQEAEYRAQCASLGLDHRVTFAGTASRETLSTYYRRAACVVFPSRAPETFGLIGPEAMSHGTPVIASAVGGIGEWLEDGVTGLAVPSNQGKPLAEAIDRVLGDKEWARRLGENGLRRYEERFTPERHADGMIALYDTLVKKGNPV